MTTLRPQPLLLALASLLATAPLLRAADPLPSPPATSSRDWNALLTGLSSEEPARRDAAKRTLDQLPEEDIAVLRPLFLSHYEDENLRTLLAERIAHMQEAMDRDLQGASEAREKGDLLQALIICDRGLALHPANARGYMLRGIIKDDMDAKDAALADYDQSLRLNPGDYLAYYNRAITKSDLHNLAGALADLDQAIATYKYDADCYYNRGNCKFDLADYDGALADYTRASELHPDDIDAIVNCGVALLRKGDLAGAAAKYQRAIELQPDGDKGYFHRGVLRQCQGDLDGALADLNRAASLNPKRGDTYVYRGAIFYSEGAWARALAEFKLAFALNPADDDLWLRLWLTRARLGDRDAATRDLRQFLDTRKDRQAALWPSTLCRFLAGRLSQADLLQAAASDNKSIHADQASAAWFAIGSVQLLDGNPTAATTAFQKVAALAVKDSLSYQAATAELQRLTPPK